MAATSTASLIAIPSEPVCCSARVRPARNTIKQIHLLFAWYNQKKTFEVCLGAWEGMACLRVGCKNGLAKLGDV